MLQDERVNAIREQILNEKKVIISELCAKYEVSDVTIRKDLQILSKEGLIKKIYGGALLIEKGAGAAAPSTDMPNKEIKDFTKKQKLIRIALTQIKDGDSLFLGSGVTCCLLAKELKKFKNLTIVTNNVSAINDLLAFPCKLYIIGGEVASVDGLVHFSSIENTSLYLNSIYVDKAFTSCSGLDLKAGVTVNSLISTYIYKAVLPIKKRWYMMVDSAKIGHMGFYRVANIEDIDYLIIDKIPNNYQQYCETHNVEILFSGEDR